MLLVGVSMSRSRPIMASSSLSTMISICSERVLNFATVRLAEENSEPTSGSDWRNPASP